MVPFEGGRISHLESGSWAGRMNYLNRSLSRRACNSSKLENGAAMDHENLEELVTEWILDEGKRVFSNDWDSGGPGAGADSELIYLWRDLYWARDGTGCWHDPCETLDEFLGSGSGFTAVTSATESVFCSEKSARESSADAR